MKIKVKNMRYEDVLALPREKYQKPIKPHWIFRLILRIASVLDLIAVGFQYRKIGMDKIGKREPCLVLMNHSSFIDLEIAATLLFPRPFNIVCTSDGFVGKNWLMRLIGCIPTKKFVSDPKLVRDMLYVVKELKSSVLMYPEASYSFDNFRWQQENEIRIPENFRAEGLNRVLYKCPHCMAEGKMLSKDTILTCQNCGKQYELTEYGYVKALEGDTEFEHIPDWYRWQRSCVRHEIEKAQYMLDIPVDICMMVNMKCIYRVGDGNLKHAAEGFHLTGCDGKLDYRQKPSSSYSLYSDYYWYEIGDVICIGDSKVLYYCFPKAEGDIVAKTRLATEEMYKLAKKSRALKM